MEPETWEMAFIERQRVARLATVDNQGRPHNIPIVFALDGRRLFTPVDAKPKRVRPDRLQRVRNIRSHPEVCVLFDEYSDDWRRLAWVQVRGTAAFIILGPERETGVALLARRYPQYSTLPLAESPVIVITIQQVTGWRAAAQD